VPNRVGWARCVEEDFPAGLRGEGPLLDDVRLPREARGYVRAIAACAARIVGARAVARLNERPCVLRAS